MYYPTVFGTVAPLKYSAFSAFKEKKTTALCMCVTSLS